MSLMNQNQKKGKKGNQQKNNQNNSKFIPKSSSNKSTGFSQRPHKAGGTRGS